MKDIYLDYTKKNCQVAQYLKVDIESNSNLLVGLLGRTKHSDEFERNLDSVRVALILRFRSGNITAWIMDPDFSEVHPDFKQKRDSTPPPHIDFTESYEDGLDDFRYILKVITGSGNDIEMEPQHEKYATKEERTVSSKRFSSQRKSANKGGAKYKVVPTTVLEARASLDQTSQRRMNSSLRCDGSPKVTSSKHFSSPRGFTSPVKKFRMMMRKLNAPPPPPIAAA